MAIATPPSSDITASLTAGEEHFLELAFQRAHEALSAQEVPVGCIFVRNQEVIAVGRNEVNETHNATRHAEMICIKQVKDYCDERQLDLTATFRDISVYVTVEPCIMCAAALYDLRVKAIVFGCKNDRFGGQTVFDVQEALQCSTTRVLGGFRKEEALQLLKEFYKGTNPSAPPAKVKIKK